MFLLSEDIFQTNPGTPFSGEKAFLRGAGGGIDDQSLMAVFVPDSSTCATPRSAGACLGAPAGRSVLHTKRPRQMVRQRNLIGCVACLQSGLKNQWVDRTPPFAF